MTPDLREKKPRCQPTFSASYPPLPNCRSQPQRRLFPVGVGSGQVQRAHVGDIEQTGMFAGPEMFLQDPVPVLDRHGIARKGHHACTGREVGVIERGLFQGVVGHGGRSS